MTRPKLVASSACLLTSFVLSVTLSCRKQVDHDAGPEEPIEKVTDQSISSALEPHDTSVQVIKSQLWMEFRARIDGAWETVGETPGTVHIPECEELELSLLGLTERDCEAYKEELERLRITRVQLPQDTLRLQKYRDSKLLDNVTSLTIRCYDYGVRDISALAGLSKLTSLDLTPSCDLEDLSAVSGLPNLTSLSIGNCPRLESLTPITSLDRLTHLRLPSELTNEQIEWLLQKGVLTDLKSLTLTQTLWKDLSALPRLRNLTSLGLVRCNMLTDVSSLVEFPNLESLQLSGCDRLTDVAALSELTNLHSLRLCYCGNLAHLPDLSGLSKMRSLDLSACDQLTDLTAISSLTTLTRLDVSFCRNRSDLSGIEGLTNLKSLNLRNCRRLTDISALAELTNIESLNLSQCTDLRDISSLANLEKLRSLDLHLGARLDDVSPLYGLNQLTELHTPDTLTQDMLKELHNRGVMKKLCLLDLGCGNLTEVSLAGMPHLSTLRLWGCENLTHLSLSDVPNLTRVRIDYAPNLKSREFDGSPIGPRELVEQLTKRIESHSPRIPD